jgi:membrane-associated protein
MSDPSQILQHWGYPAIFFFVFLGNLGFPVPEETVLTLSGFLVWKGELHFFTTAVVGILSAIAGDNFGYWMGRRFGISAILRFGHLVFITADRVGKMQRLMWKYGPAGVFLARFIPGLRFLAGPLAGTASMPFRKFFIANCCGATIYVPLMVAVGYGVAVGLEDQLKRLESLLGNLTPMVWFVLAGSAMAIVVWRVAKVRQRVAASKD